MTQDLSKYKYKSFNYNKYINYCFIGLAFSIPISKALTSIFTALMILLWLLEGNFKDKFYIIARNKLSVAILLLVGFSIVAILWSSNLHFVLKFLRIKYWYFSPVIIMLTSHRLKYTKYVLDGFLLSMFFSEIASYGVYFGLWSFNHATHSDPTVFMDHISYSIYLALTIMILLIKIFEQESLKLKIPLIIFLLTATTNLFINGGRTGQFSLIITIIVIVIVYYKKSYKILFSSIVMVMLVIPLAYKYSPNFHNRMAQLHVDVNNAYYHHNFNGSLSTRIALWTVGINKFIDHPWLGSGIGNEMKDIKSYTKKYNFNKKFLKTFTDYSNNFINYAVQLGIFGLILNILIFYYLFVLKIKEKRYKILSVSFAIILLLYAMGGVIFQTINPMSFFVVFAGLFNAIAQREKSGMFIK